jgi:phage terminase large subunit GpA-like protein
MREPMQAISDRRTREVVVMSSSQVGKTELLLNAAGYFIQQDPSPILAIQPTLEMARDWSRTKLASLIRESIPGIVAEARSRDSDNTALFKKFPGGFLAIQGSNSPAGLASRSVRVLLLG